MSSLKSRLSRVEFLWVLCVVAVTAHFAFVYSARKTFLNLEDYAAGKVLMPFQGRILMSWLLDRCRNSGIIASVARHAPAPWNTPYEVTLLGTSFLGFAGTIMATRRSITTLTGNASYARWAAFLVGWMVYFNLAVSYGLIYKLPYDVPSVFFFSVAVMSILERRQWLLYIIFAIGTLNRETFCFVTLFYVVWHWSSDVTLTPARRALRILPGFLLQAGIWLGIRTMVAIHFRNNPHENHGNGYFVDQLPLNLHYLINPFQWPLFFSIFGFLWVPLIFGRRFLRHPALAAASASVSVVWLAAMTVVGVLVEIRIFNELSAILALVAAIEAYHLWFMSGPLLSPAG